MLPCSSAISCAPWQVQQRAGWVQDTVAQDLEAAYLFFEALGSTVAVSGEDAQTTDPCLEDASRDWLIVPLPMGYPQMSLKRRWRRSSANCVAACRMNAFQLGRLLVKNRQRPTPTQGRHRAAQATHHRTPSSIRSGHLIEPNQYRRPHSLRLAMKGTSVSTKTSTSFLDGHRIRSLLDAEPSSY